MVKESLESLVKAEKVEEEPVISVIPSESEPEEEKKTIQKSKKPRSQAQIDAFAKVIEKRTEKRQERAVIVRKRRL